MKRRLLSLFFISAFTLTGFTQSLELSNNEGVVIPANSVITQHVPLDSGTFYTYLSIKNISNVGITVLCKKSQLVMLDSTLMTFCWAGQCYDTTKNISEPKFLDSGQIDTEFVADYFTKDYISPFKPGESVVRWVFYNQDTSDFKSDSVSVTIKYSTYGVGIADGNVRQASLSNTYPNPANANASFSYSVPSGSDVAVVVRNILGSTMLSEPLSAGNGKYTINTGNLSDGIYFYSLMVDGKISQTKKLIVKH